MNKTETYQVNDKFLCDFFNKIPYPELKLLDEAIRNNFVKVIKNNIITTPDWKNSHQLYRDAVNLIYKTLFDISDNEGFPKARLFVEKYIFNKDEHIQIKHIQIKDIIMYYLQEELIRNREIRMARAKRRKH